jgi:16S rRNA (cytosine1402-N4)-methyltransferase
MFRGRRSTPSGEHRPVLLEKVLEVLAPAPGAILVDCTVGWAGHAVELVRRVGPSGKLIGLDIDAENLPRARQRLEETALPFALHHANFAGLPAVLAAEGIDRVDGIVADLGMSSMQVDDAERGFSYSRDGPLDMRMDRSRGRTAAEILATIPEEDLARALHDFGDEPHAEMLARRITTAREQRPLLRTKDLAEVLLQGATWRLHPSPGRWETHPAARTFQALRVLVNREQGNLEHLLRILPAVLRPGGVGAIISFHSGEDRLVKTAFREGLRSATYTAAADEPLRPDLAERQANPRSRSAKLRWARRGTH